MQQRRIADRGTPVGTGDILRRLFEAFAAHDDGEIRAAAEALILDERAKNHRLLAEDLERILVGAASRKTSGSLGGFELPRPEPLTDRERGLPLIDIQAIQPLVGPLGHSA